MEMPKIDSFWDEQLVNPAHGGHRHAAPAVPQPVGGSGAAHNPYERNLNFATVAVEDGDYGFPKKKTVRDPLSHRIIEKRRRDRMNNCLADLARLLPPSSLRKGRGRIEKTEIVELAIKHLRHLQCHPCPMGDKCEFSRGAENSGGHSGSPTETCSSSSISSGYHSTHEEQYRLGYQECLSEAMHFLVEQEGLYAGDAMCVRLVKHLNNHCDTVLRDHWGTQGKIVPTGFCRTADDGSTDFKKTGCSGGSSSSGYHPNGSSSGSDGNGGNDGESTEPFVLPVQNPPHHLNMEASRQSSVIDFEAENSCSSTPLSIETSDVLSLDGKNTTRMSSKPPIPSIICSSNNSRVPFNSGSPATGSNGRSSDDGSANSSTSSAHRYKFKSNIKQRFTADCQTEEENGEKDGDIDAASSDTEEIHDEGISVLEDSLLKPSRHEEQSGEGEELEGKSVQQCPASRRCSSSGGAGINHSSSGEKTLPQISTAGTVSSTHEKTAFSSATANSPVGENKSSGVSVASAVEVENSGNSDIAEVKPSPEELLSAIHNLSSPDQKKSQLPTVITGESIMSDEKGVPAFALDEKGLFYVPLTIDKSVVASYINKFDSTNAPPLYPVTISVCFVLGPDKKGKVESSPESDLSTVDCDDKTVEFSHPSNHHPIPISLISAASATLLKPNRRIHRESSNFLASRLVHQRPVQFKESHHHHHNRALGHGGSAFLGYPDSSSTSSPVPTMMNDMSRRNEEIDFHSGSGSRCSSSNAGGGSSSSSSGMMGNATRGRKRSIASAPSISAASMGYHSWSEKASPNSHDFFNYHANTHSIPAIALHGHLTAAAAAAAAAASSGTLSQRHAQAMSNFHAETALREKEMCFNQEKRGKKARSVDQGVDSKQ